MSQTEHNPLDSWHLDRKVPVALIFAIAVQTIGAVWWAATISQRVETIERRTTALEITGGKTAETLAESKALLSSILATQSAMRDSLTRIERQIDNGRARPNQ
jgi:Tfp pilus assembly protein PilO